jgi:hypothetical protein
MTNFVEKYLDVDSLERRGLLGSWLHGIKREDEEECWKYFENFDFNKLSVENRELLIRLTVCIEASFFRRFGKAPKWCEDPRLSLDEAYVDEGSSLIWLLYGPQSMHSHNCFFDPGGLDVL